MAGNFWLSSHFQQWLLTKEEILAECQLVDLRSLTLEEYQKIHIFFAHFIQSLGEFLKMRQQVIATATVYFKRFYARTSLKSIDPLLMAPTCLFVASKVEEFGPMSSNRITSSCSNICKTKFAYVFGTGEFPYRISQIFECEFFLLEAMDCCLVVYHPYRPLIKYVTDMGQEESLLPFAWKVVNDSLRTNVCLIYPPYLVALAAVYMACIFQKKDCTAWFTDLNVDMEKILEIVREMLSLYELWKNFDQKKEIPSIIQKMPKPTVNPSRSATPISAAHRTASPAPPNMLAANSFPPPQQQPQGKC